LKPLSKGGSSFIILDTYYFSYFLCFAVSTWLVLSWQKKQELRVLRHQAIDLVIISILGVMLGAKTFYALFYNLTYYLEHPLDFFLNWSGMASHGAMVGVLVGIILYAKRSKLPLWHLLDYASLCGALAPLFIRPANFLNAELYGRSVPNWFPFGMRFPMRDGAGHSLFIDESQNLYQLSGELLKPFTSPIPHAYESFEKITQILPRQVFSAAVENSAEGFIQVARLVTDPSHPAQIYQMILSGFILSSFLFYLRFKKLFDGAIFSALLIGYGLTRFLTEFFRQQDFQRSAGVFEWISMGQLISLLVIAAGLVTLKLRLRASAT